MRKKIGEISILDEPPHIQLAIWLARHEMSNSQLAQELGVSGAYLSNVLNYVSGDTQSARSRPPGSKLSEKVRQETGVRLVNGD